MVRHTGFDNVDLKNVKRGDEVIVQVLKSEFVDQLKAKADKLHCKLITLQYGKFYMKNDLKNIRQEKLDKLIKLI
jgi:chaperonin cofactor prefoldin